MNGIRRLSQKQAHMLFVWRMERGRTVVGAVLSPFFCCQQTNIDCSEKGVKGNTQQE